MTELQREIARLEAHIRRGDELARQGFDTGFLNTVNRHLLNTLYAQQKIIAVDFDGCLCVNAFPEIGEPIVQTIEALKAEQAAGAKVILWTCRHDEPLEAAVAWCAEQGIQFDAVNANLPLYDRAVRRNPQGGRY